MSFAEPNGRLVRHPKVDATPRVVLGQITSEVGGGAYAWSLFAGDGPPSGQASELNGSTGITAGTRVVLHEAGASWYFFFPVEPCA